MLKEDKKIKSTAVLSSILMNENDSLFKFCTCNSPVHLPLLRPPLLPVYDGASRAGRKRRRHLHEREDDPRVRAPLRHRSHLGHHGVLDDGQAAAGHDLGGDAAGAQAKGVVAAACSFELIRG